MCSIAFPNSPGESLDFTIIISGNSGNGCLISHFFSRRFFNSTGEILIVLHLIELTGGETTECSTCPNYKYEDLTDYYWPALIGGVLKYSNQSKADYVGFSNVVDVHVKNLRRKLDDGDGGDVLETVRGIGYRLAE